MFNTEIEASVIGGLLISGLTPDASDVLSTLEPEAFSSDFYRDIYKTIQKQAKTRNLIDMMMVAEAMGDGNFGSVMTLAKNCPSAANIKGYAGMVFDNYRRRKMLSLMDSVRREIEHGTIENASRAINQFMSDATELNSSKDDIKPVHLSELIADYTEVLENRLKNGAQSDTLKTGIYELDEITGGINQVDLVIVAARPGMGKTELALKIAESVAEQKITGTNQNRGILIFSMEMDAQQIIERQIANSSMLPVSTLRNPAKMNDEGWGRISAGIGRMHELDIWVVDASKLSVEQIDAIATRHKKSYSNLSLIMVDYLGLIEKPSAERNDLAVAYISSSLKRIAKKLKTPVMSLSQLSRDVEKRVNKRPVNADLRDSGSIEQDADSIIMLYRDAMYNDDSQAAKYAEIIVTKNRFGKTGTVYQEFRNGHFMETNQQEAAKACQTKSNSFQKKYSKGAPI